MQDSFLALNPFALWLDMVSEASGSFFGPSSGAAATSTASLPMTERHEDHSLYVASNAPRRGSPMLVMLHGAGQDANDFAVGTGMNSAAERHGFIVLYPEQSTRRNAHQCWNWFDAAHQTRSEGEPAHIVALTLQVARKHKVDPERIFVAGLSAGGAMAALLGELCPDVYAAVGVHSGLPARAGTDLSSGLAAMRAGARAGRMPTGMPTIVFHGDEDGTVNPVNGAQVIEASLGIDCPFEAWEHTGPDGRRFTRRVYARDGAEAGGEYWTVHDAAHAWSGGNAAGSFADPLGPDASEEMLRFFKDRRRSAAR